MKNYQPSATSLNLDVKKFACLLSLARYKTTLISHLFRFLLDYDSSNSP